MNKSSTISSTLFGLKSIYEKTRQRPNLPECGSVSPEPNQVPLLHAPRRNRPQADVLKIGSKPRRRDKGNSLTVGTLIFHRTMKHDINKLVQYIKDYANFHYEDGGWDVIAECWEDKDILKVLARDNAKTEKESLASFKDIVAVWTDQQSDANNSRF